MNELKLSTVFSYDPVTHKCTFDAFDTQLAEAIFFDDNFDEEDFDEEEVNMTYDCIQDLIEEKLESIGFCLCNDKNPRIPKELIDSVFNIIKERCV